MTQQLDPKQVRGLKEELDTLDSMVKIKSIGANLSLDADGELSATGGGGGGDAKLYSTLGNNIDGALTQKASTDLLVHTKPDGVNDLIANNKITLGYLPDSVLGQVVYGGGFVPSTAVATLTTNAQEKLGTSDATITLTNDTTAITGYEANEGIYYIATASGTFASISFETGDWLISTGTAWSKVDNTDAVTGVKGNEEVNYRLGNVNITAQNVGAVTSDNAISTQDITPFITTSMINDSAITTAKIQDEAVTTAKIDDGAITTAKIASGAVTSSNIDWTTLEVSPSTFMTLGSNFEYINRYCRVEKFGKLVFARLVIHKTSGTFTPTTEVVGAINDGYLPSGTLNYGGFLGGEYNTLDSAYVFCNSAVKDFYATASSTSNCTYLKLMLTYSTD